MTTVHELAAEALANLVHTKRGGETLIVTIRDGAPEWVTDLCREAHGDMFPDDWRFEFIQDALRAIEEDNENFPDVDSLYPYTADRTAWLASRCDRAGYCDEAAAGFGTPPDGVLGAIALGMVWELDEVRGLVRGFLEKREAAELEAIEASNDADAMQEAGDE